MKDSLKDFVEQNREEFDVFEPRPELWQEICKELPAKKEEAKVIRFSFGDNTSFSTDFAFMRVAAAVLLLLGCGLTLLLTKQNVANNANTIAATEQVTINRIAPELVEVEAYYTTLINSKKNELSDYDLKVLGLDDDQSIDRELARLDSNYKELKQQLYTTPNTEKVMGAMIQNLQIRIEVLNRQLEVLEKIEQMQKTQNINTQSDETTNASTI
ncbi:hypothetical protein FVR03_04290 [Pontibacter qinzhouensis]|uniref:Anti-sigma factor n=1 Tax=Pontibacter qinzhouensis TaxID=2603253 RepID=A0A5C8KBV2_9BACT|nr:hypothetical protein [Pontibacter qinzhouensis]TXK50879.1 hypothetical protein FVR03_04290 [Pontibacter qinzhouensis]